MSGLGFRRGERKYSYEHKNLDWIDTSLTINVVMTPLATVNDFKGAYLKVEQTNNGATAETISVTVTIDGTDITSTQACDSGQIYYLSLDEDNALVWGTAILQMRSIEADQSVELETKSFAISCKQTTTVDGTSAQIEVNMVYALKELT